MKKNSLYIGLIVIGLTLLLRQIESIPHGIIVLGLGIGIGLEIIGVYQIRRDRKN